MTSKVTPELVQGSSIIGPKSETLVNCKGQRLHCSYWSPVEGKELRGLAYLCHGFGEHLQWYEDLALRLTDLGVLAFGHDHIGHGRSEGIRGHVTSVNEYVNDVIAHCQKIKGEYREKSCFIIGHSMGGLIAIQAANRSADVFDGVVLMGPLIKPNPDEATPFKIRATKVLSKMLPYMTVARLNEDHVTRDDEMKKKLAKDPLRYRGGIRARWAMACFEELGILSEELETINWPFLILHGERDKLCQPEASRDLYKKARSSDKKLKVFPDAYHHLYLEVPEVRKQALKDTVDWVEARLPAS